MKLIIAEKPDVARSIARALGVEKKGSNYFEGNGYIVTSAVGHIYGLYDVKDYDPEKAKWKAEFYPFIPEKFLYKPIIKDRVNLIKELYKKADSVVNACDGEREGELIFSVIKNQLGFNKPIQRMWLSTHTEEDVKKGIKQDRDTTNLAKAAYVRQWLDWLIGINFTVVYSLKSNVGKPLKVGRVILPTLKLVYDRDIEIENFKSKDYSLLEAIFKKDAIEYKGVLTIDEQDRFFDGEDNIDLESIFKRINNKEGIITEYNENLVKENAPRLFNLTDLQRHITSGFKGFTADKVLSVAQELYESGYISYPRTSSRYLDNSQAEGVKRTLGVISKAFNYSTEFSLGKNLFNSSKVDSHPALTPTYKLPGGLSPTQEIVYMEIVKRFAANFMEASLVNEIGLVTSVESYSFVTKERTIQKLGWRSVYKDKIEISVLNKLQLKDRVVTKSAEVRKEKTKPKKHHTEATLLSAMENCGKSVENEEDILKGFSVGTTATRAETLKKLVDCDYVVRQGKNLLITDLGRFVIENFPLAELLDVEFTGRIEKSLKDIELGQLNPEKFFKEIKDMVADNINRFKAAASKSFSSQPNLSEKSSEKAIVGTCPVCGKNIYENPKGFGCEGYRDKSCSFALWKNDKYLGAFGKKLSSANAKKLLKGDKIVFKDLKSKKGSKYTAEFVYVKKDNGYWGYEMSFPGK